MPRRESMWDRRMRENRTSGGTRGEAIVHARYADIEPQPGKPRNRCRPKPKHALSLVYSTLLPSFARGVRFQIVKEQIPAQGRMVYNRIATPAKLQANFLATLSHE